MELEDSKHAYLNPALEPDTDQPQSDWLHHKNSTSGDSPSNNGCIIPVVLSPCEYQKSTALSEKNNLCDNLQQLLKDMSKHKDSNFLDKGKNSFDLNLEENLKEESFCSSRGKFVTIISWIAFAIAFYAALVAITRENALPGGNFFSLFVLLIAAQLGGNLVEKINLPPLLGMLIVGILLRSVPHVNWIGESIDPLWSSTIRKMALVIILTRAGLGLDAKALRKLSFVVIRMGIVPNVAEMSVTAVVSHYLLSLPWLWSFMLGFIFSAVSPSVVVPCMLNLADRRLGIDKGIPTLIIAALSIDNALSISGIGVFLGIIFSSGSVVWQGFKGPVEVFAGIAWGIIMGFICWNIPNRFEKGYPKFRFYFLFVLGLLSVFGSKWLKFGGAGAMGCLTTAFVAEIGWRNQGWIDGKQHPVKKNFNFLWQFYQPLLFGLIGAEIQLSTLNGMTVVWGLLTLVIGVTCRIGTCFMVLQGSELNVREKLLTAVSWLPKATIQAAFGSAALDTARSFSPLGEETQEMIYGKQVLTLAVLAIVFLAPFGATLIMLSGPKLLKEAEEGRTEKTEKEICEIKKPEDCSKDGYKA